MNGPGGAGSSQDTWQVAAVDGWFADHRDEMLTFLSRLVQIRSDVRPPHAEEGSCQELVAGEFRKAGLDVDVFGLDEVPGLREHPLTMPTWDGMERPFAGRPDVVGSLRGTGGGQSLLISSHVDTVGVSPGDWRSGDPFSGRIDGPRLYGRGSWDTKWGIAASLYAARCIRELGIGHRGDLIIESVVDEEFGGSHGVLAARMRGHRADVAINCEPTGMVVGTAHRGGGEWRISVSGEDRGMAFGEERQSNAVLKLAATVSAISRWNDARNRDRTPSVAFADNPELPACIMQVEGGGAAYSDATGAPARCSLLVWVEEEPGVSEAMHREGFIGRIDGLLRADEAFCDGVLPDYQPTIRYLPGSESQCPPLFMDVLSAAFASAGAPFRCAGVPLAADTYMFNLHFAMPAITIGPRGGNAHAADEFVFVDDVVQLARIFSNAALRWCA